MDPVIKPDECIYSSEIKLTVAMVLVVAWTSA